MEPVEHRDAAPTDRGATMMEYAVVVALIAVIALAGVRAAGHGVSTTMCQAAGKGVMIDKQYNWDGEKCAPTVLGP